MDDRSQLSLTWTSKGLENKEGQNNCFLNVGIQSLWHLEPFHRAFVQLSQHAPHPAGDPCVFCALKVCI
jgi:hypothetical protein